MTARIGNLVLGMKIGESVVCDGPVRVTFVRHDHGHIVMAFEAEAAVKIWRPESKVAR